MLSAAATSSAPFAVTYNNSGGTLSPFPSEPTKQKIGLSSGQGSTTTEDYEDKITLSASGVEQSQQVIALENESSKAADTSNGEKQVSTEVQAKTGIQKLTPAEEQVVQQLQNRDREVKTHEMAHLASAGQYARGSPSYSYQMGPDGQRYAIGGEVSIDISKERTPEQTMQKMEVVISAALAPAQPSPADRSIAAAAAAMHAQAQQEIQIERMEATQEQGKTRAESQTAGEQTLKNNSDARDSAYRIQPLNIVA
jgi:hypothetical protein